MKLMMKYYMKQSLKLNQRKKEYKPRDPNYNTIYYHKNVAPGECNICGCSVVNRALYNHKKTAKFKLVQHFKELAKLEYDDLKLLPQKHC
jgi:hypothetical protein